MTEKCNREDICNNSNTSLCRHSDPDIWGCFVLSHQPSGEIKVADGRCIRFSFCNNADSMICYYATTQDKCFELYPPSPAEKKLSPHSIFNTLSYESDPVEITHKLIERIETIQGRKITSIQIDRPSGELTLWFSTPNSPESIISFIPGSPTRVALEELAEELNVFVNGSAYL